jgi:hypothetical protein
MLFSKVSKSRCQQINTNVWDKARKTLDFAHSVAYTIVRGKNRLGTHSTYVCYGQRKDPLGMTLGPYSLLPITPDNIKKQVHKEIGNLVFTLDDASRSILYSMQSSKTFLDVKDKYQIPEVFDHKNLDKKTKRRGFVT